MGWLCVGWVVPLYRMVGLVPISLMFAGGLSYTGGLLFYRWERLPFSRPMWHLCVVVGSAAFFLAISRFLQM
jgi:hemolysin III